MAANPVQTYLALYSWVAQLTVKAVARKAHYLLIAPIAAFVYQQLSSMLFRMAPGQWGLVVGLIDWFMFTATISLVLFVGRAVVEQRVLRVDDIQTGLWAFAGDVMTVLFPFWVLSFLIGAWSGPLELLAIAVLPLFETIAFTRTSGYGVFEASYRFVARDIAAWGFGQLPLLTLIAVLNFGNRMAAPLLPYAFIGVVMNAVFWIIVLTAFIYRGILFLTLEQYSPRRRAERFGGETGVG